MLEVWSLLGLASISVFSHVACWTKHDLCCSKNSDRSDLCGTCSKRAPRFKEFNCAGLAKEPEKLSRNHAEPLPIAWWSSLASGEGIPAHAKSFSGVHSVNK